MRLRLAPFFIGFLALLLDCAPLDPIASEQCGNGVIDAKEDCDSFPSSNDSTKPRCGGPTEGDFACHLRCGVTTSGATVCPEGWGCSTRGICRAPTGSFSSALGSVSGGAVRLSVGDFDGDGRKDIVASAPPNARSSSRVRVHYFDDLGGLAQVSSLPAAVISPAVYDHDHNGRDDIAFGIPVTTQNATGGVGVVSGLADRTFLPVVFPTVTLDDTSAVPLFIAQTLSDTRLPNGSDSAILLFAESKMGAAIVSIDNDLGGTARLATPLPAGVGALRGRPVAARVYELNTASACSEVVAAMQIGAAGRLFVLSPCIATKLTKTSRWDQSPGAFTSFDLPPLADRSRGVLVADVDSDTHMDVLVDTSDGPYVLFGDGLVLAPPVKWTPAGLSSALTMPLAAADLTSDGTTDFVFPSFIATGVPKLPPIPGAPPDHKVTVVEPAKSAQQLEPWSAALVGRFNGDAFPDLVVTHAGAPDLELYAGGASGITVSTVTTDGVVQAIAVGDFDGDHIDDVGFTQSTSTPDTSSLAIAYGRATGGLEQPTRIGSVDKAVAVSALQHGSGPADLGTYSVLTRGNVTSTSLTLLIGSGDRQPLAALALIDLFSCSRTDSPCKVPRTTPPSVGPRPWSPVSVVAGPFIHQAQSSVAVYAVANAQLGRASANDPFGVWVADGNTDAPGGLTAPIEQKVLDGQFAAYEPASRSVRLATAIRDVDNAPDGLAEVLALSNTPNGQDGVLVVVRPGRADDFMKVLPGLTVTASAQVDAVDIDGDGLPDAIGIFGAPPDGRLVAFLNDGNGGFIVPGIPLTIPPPGPGEIDPGKPVAFADIFLRGAPPVAGPRIASSLAVLTNGSVVLATLRGDKQGFDVTPLAKQLGGKALVGATGIAAGDFNGDGVEDIAIADGGIRIMLQQPAGASK